jgi:prepilin-type N-terminal cleavage/methylation domain-containing protein
MVTKRRAFTLIELLVVIAIIAILAAILFPVFARAKIAAKKTVGMSNQKQLGMAILMYANDQDDSMPLPDFKPDIVDSNGNIVYQSWRYVILPYIKSVDLFSSPGDAYTDFDYSTWWQTADPSMDWQAGIKLGYAGSSWAHPTQVEELMGGSISGIVMTTCPVPSQKMMINESQYPYADLGEWALSGWNDIGGDQGSAPMTTYAGKTNVSFYDTHVNSFHPCQTFGSMKNWDGDVPADDFMYNWWNDNLGGSYDTNGYQQILAWQQDCWASYTGMQ